MNTFFSLLTKYQKAIDRFTEISGQLVSWLTLLMMLVTCLVVVMRYVLGSSSIAIQESISYLHATLFLAGIAYTLKRDSHVRVDVLYRRFSSKTKAWVDLLGGLFLLLPVSIVILLFCWDYVLSSWAINEASKEPNGLPGVYLLKTLMLVMPVTVILQATSEIIRNLFFILKIQPLPSHPKDVVRV